MMILDITLGSFLDCWRRSAGQRRRLRPRAAPFKVACSPTTPALQAELPESSSEEVAMATERQREIRRRRKRREKRLKARTREARKHKKKR
jgi:hypothetical protein